MTKDRAAWQLPQGVSRGTWDYVTTSDIATDYDSFHGTHPLMTLDGQLLVDIQEGFPVSNQPRVAVDLGCGTGRSLLRLGRPGWRCIGVDLSSEMLKVTQAKSIEAGQAIATLRSNMVELDCLVDQAVDFVVCMYSSYGMIRGSVNRCTMLKHVYRILKPGGRFVVHVHNRGSWLRDPNGVWLTLRGWIESKRTSTWELGDRIYPYRGLPSMYLHAFSATELLRELQSAGLKIDDFIRLNRTSSGQLTRPSVLPHLRAGGFIACCTKPA
jgi:ubiquinone/menaquinone biosynthesis C-methylase UbiE